MKIIQSFAQFKEGSPYAKNKNISLNFYSFLLSYLTLNKYYGHVTMICNKDAYDNFIKYIPYDEIIFFENKNCFDFWSAYKIAALKLIDDDVIHVDSDVFIFGDLFRPFIDNNYDIIVQSVSKNNDTTIDYVKNNSEFLKFSGIIDGSAYDGGFLSCGVLGIKKRVKKNYYDAIEKTYSEMKHMQVKGVDKIWYSMILEESTLYLVTVNNNYKVYGIIPPEIINQVDTPVMDNVDKYTHMWFASKFNERNIELIKRKIRTEFPYYRNIVDKFEIENIYK